MDGPTTISDPRGADDRSPRFIGARILAHPQPSRVGEFAALLDEEAGPGRSISVSRTAPTFRTPNGQPTGPLGSARITRHPLDVTWVGDGLLLAYPSGGPPTEVNGVPITEERLISHAELEAGLVVLGGNDLALWIGWMELAEPPPPIQGLIGESTVMRRLRRQIHQVADLDVPVLLRGATGVGKELVAAAIHRHSRRGQATYVAVNVAGVPPTMAASELFGHRRGAFTGASEERKGYFSQADGGTLFLDEIGDIAFDVQALLLRAVQEGVIQPLGGSTRQVDVRLVAATDSDLESAVARREFREPLLRRFAYEIHVPPLRVRREDVGMLFFHFLGRALDSMGQGHRLGPRPDDQPPFIPAACVAELARHDWPGNVRELANVALRLAVENRGRDRATVPADLWVAARGTEPVLDTAAAVRRRPDEVSDAEILVALESEGFRRDRAARRLGVSRTYLYKRLEESPVIPAAGRLDAETVRSALASCGGDVAEAARRLHVSPRALQLQLKRLGVG